MAMESSEVVPASELDLDDYPGLEIAYQQAKGSLYEQCRVYESYQTRIQHLLAISTALIAIGLPIALSRLPPPPYAWAGWAGLIPVALYIWLIREVWQSLRLRGMQTLDQPAWIRLALWARKPQDALVRLLASIEESHEENEQVLKEKQAAVNRVMPLAGALVGAVLLVSGLLVALSAVASSAVAPSAVAP